MTTLKQTVQRQERFTAAHYDYEKGLNVYAYFKVNDRTKSEDMVQNTFLKAWSYIIRGKKIDTMKGFLYHILNNLIIDEYRSRKHTTISLDALSEKGFDPSTEDSTRLASFIDGRAALLLIKELPKIYRGAVHMRFVQNLSIKEISAITGETKNVVAVHICRGLEKLKLLCDPALSTGGVL